ncbi:3-isopropylmalate dehydrogenase [Chishuiella changwenlii]|jgi:3-isopropylmalate dehydrogenase|uniref:3-isopropylmalate dehydrogenase n=1 Tax=Chishuiella changwenlii TaxID=1434701 RepID=A0A1M6WE83_9FLAO|nr:3-isopropylmalate dehydrogenase [Chishuiella changwenlii]GGF05146.1 3-isopropylmalate dehydrogenase [Chishuiella changwenlii]SHK91765.1 3-isopropylmalate dehydrogenase [Chishuiella changwenlii]
MKTHKIAVLSGDGIGPEVVFETVKILKVIEKVFDYNFAFEDALIGAIAIDETGNPLPDNTLQLCKDADAVLFGSIGDPKYDNDPNAKVRPEQGLLKLRKELGLFANIRPIKAYNSLLSRSPLKKSRIEGTDMVIFRELINGIYFGEKFTAEDFSYAYDTCSYSRADIEQIAHLAFQEATKRRKKVTLVDKANVLDTSRLWRKVTTEISKEYPDVELDFLFVDNAAMQLILNPKQFDVILTENMFGDIISDEGSVIGGSIGLLPSASIGLENALFEPIHGSYPQAKGKGIANPMASILSAAMMLRYLGLEEGAKAIEDAVENAINNLIVTSDLDETSDYSTSVVANYVIKILLNEHDHDSYFNFENIMMGKSTII